jgi:hypothetical protein
LNNPLLYRGIDETALLDEKRKPLKDGMLIISLDRLFFSRENVATPMSRKKIPFFCLV